MSSFLMGYPHAPHHVQGSMSSSLDAKFPPVADDYHHYSGHYSMTASTGHLGASMSNSAASTGMHSHAHAADMVNDYMVAAAHHHHSHHHSNNALAAHHQNVGFSNYASTPNHHHHAHQGLGYYGHHAAAVAAAAVHQPPEYISTGAVNSADAVGSLGNNVYPPAANTPNSSNGLSTGSGLTSNGYYNGFYSTNANLGNNQSQAHSPHTQIMDLPLQCSTIEPPSNTALGLQELGESHKGSTGGRKTKIQAKLFESFLSK